jgi:SAM-dependent methyltransferase
MGIIKGKALSRSDFITKGTAALRRVMRWDGGGQTTGRLPVNFRELDASPVAIARDVEYAVNIGEGYLGFIRDLGVDISGKSVLELGPGINYGSMLLLACHSARPTVSDRFLSPWRDDYHGRFYTALRQWLTEHRPRLDTSPVAAVLAARGYPRGVISEVAYSAEYLKGVQGKSMDIVVSNAVLEHVMSPPDVARELFRIARRGGYSIHQVDFRDHRDFSRPLEYLLLPEGAFETMFADRHGECGRQMRHIEMQRCFEQAGFRVLSFEANWIAEDSYLDEFIPRLRAADSSAYRAAPRETLRIISGRFALRRPEDS